MAAASAEDFGELLTGGEHLRLLPELWRWTRRRSPYTIPSLTLVGLQRLAQRLPDNLERALEAGVRLRDEMLDLIADGVWLHPPYTRPAPRHYSPLATPLDWLNTAIVNALELPATQVPMGLNRRGLPLGVQVIGGHLADHVTIAVAQALEAAFGGWRPPNARWYNPPSV